MMEERTVEMNFDGLVGPTHGYAGLSYGNPAAMRHEGSMSNPREALRQGLDKMKLCADLGIPQGVLPPRERPYLPVLRRLGFQGSDEDILRQAAAQDPVLLAASASASSMWAANAATVSPSADTDDGRVHFTPANLTTQFHRSLETVSTAEALRLIFPSPEYFVHHPPLPSGPHFSDEGAANHTRLCPSIHEPGLEIFVYGKKAFHSSDALPKKYPARQTMEASNAVARLHGLHADRVLFLKQNPDAVDAGVFHNDVIAVGHENVFLVHEQAFAEGKEAVAKIKRAFEGLAQAPPHVIEIPRERISLETAVETYLFNSQLLTLPDRSLCLLAPKECAEHPAAAHILEELPELGTPIRRIVYVDVRQSMKNGGGPACLRLRVVLRDQERRAVHANIVYSAKLHQRLLKWGDAHYRDRLHPRDLADPALLRESRTALDELTDILELGPFYDFQREPMQSGNGPA